MNKSNMLHDKDTGAETFEEATVSTSTSLSTPNKVRVRRLRERKLVEFDEELLALGAEMAAIFKESSRERTRQVTPETTTTKETISIDTRLRRTEGLVLIEMDDELCEASRQLAEAIRQAKGEQHQ